MYPSLRDVQYLLSVVYHNLGMKNERQDAATRHAWTEEHLRQLEAIVSDDQILEIFELLTTVGAALASR
jgi:anaphase-promoting complex subunit 5